MYSETEDNAIRNIPTARARLYSETEDNAIPTVPAMTSEEDGDVTSPSKKQKKQKKAKKY